MKKKPTKITIDCRVHLKTLSRLTKSQARDLLSGVVKSKLFFMDLPDGKFSLQIDYPFGGSRIHLFKINMPEYVGELFWKIGQYYKKLYKTPDKSGIWGHCFNNLSLDTVYIDLNKNLITLDIGS